MCVVCFLHSSYKTCGQNELRNTAYITFIKALTVDPHIGDGQNIINSSFRTVLSVIFNSFRRLCHPADSTVSSG